MNLIYKVKVDDRDNRLDLKLLTSKVPVLQNAAYIITGAQGDLGQAYIKALGSIVPPKNIYNIHRRDLTSDAIPIGQYIQTDLNNFDELVEAMASMPLANYEEIVVIHPVGKFKLEMERSAGSEKDVDEEIILSNVHTAKNIIKYLSVTLPQVHILFVGFSSIVERYNFPYFYSYDHAKKLLKEHLRSLQSQYIKSVVFNISTLNTSQERKLRPYAEDTEYWLTVDELVNWSLGLVFKSSVKDYEEVDIYIDRNDFDEEKFVKGHRQRWLRETGLER